MKQMINDVNATVPSCNLLKQVTRIIVPVNFTNTLLTNDGNALWEARDIVTNRLHMHISRLVSSSISSDSIGTRYILTQKGRKQCEMGFAPGKKIGIILKHLLESVINNPGLNTYNNLKEIVEKKYLSPKTEI